MQFSLKVLLFWVFVVCLVLGILHRPLCIFIENLNLGSPDFWRPFLHLAWLAGMDVTYKVDSEATRSAFMAAFGCFVAIMLHVEFVHLFILGLLAIIRWVFLDISWKKNWQMFRRQFFDSSPLILVALVLAIILGPFIGLIWGGF